MFFAGFLQRLKLARLRRSRESRHAEGPWSRRSPQGGGRSHMKLVRLKRGNTIRHSPSRCEAMGEGGRRPGEGSFFDREKHFKNITLYGQRALTRPIGHPLPS